MCSDWPQMRLGEAFTLIRRGVTPKYTEDSTTGVTVINQKCIRDGAVSLIPARLTEPVKAIGTDRWLQAGDVLVNSTGAGTLGRTAQWSSPEMQATADSHVTICRPSAGVDDGFIAYVMRQLEPAIEDLALGSTGQTELSPGMLSELVFSCPPLPEQRRISAVLGALDRLVESNQRLVMPLRDLAIAVLTRASVNGESFRVGDVADVRRGLSYKGSGLSDSGLPMVNMGSAANFGWLKRSGWKFYVGDYKPRHLAHSGDLIVMNTEQTWRNEILGWPLLVPDDVPECLFTHHTYLVDFHEEQAWLRLPLWAHLYSQEARADLVSKVQGSTVANLPISGVENLTFPAPLPSDPALRLAPQLLAAAWDAEREATRLATVRDELLPLLLSGRVTTREVAA